MRRLYREPILSYSVEMGDSLKCVRQKALRLLILEILSQIDLSKWNMLITDYITE